MSGKILDVLTLGLIDLDGSDKVKKIKGELARPDPPKIVDKDIKDKAAEARVRGGVETVKTGVGGVETDPSKLAKKTLLSG